MSERGRAARRWLGAAVSGVLCALAFPDPGLCALAWVGLAPLLVSVQRAASAREAALLPALWSVVVSLVAGTWFPGAVIRYFEQHAAVALVLYVATIVLTGSVYYALFGVAYRMGRSLPPPARVLLAAAAWTGVELLRVRLPGLVPGAIGNPWGLLGYTQAGWPAAIQIASATGVYGVGFVLVACNAGLAEAWLAGRTALRRAAPALAVGLAPGLLAVAFGAWTLACAPAPGTETGTVVGVVQGNLAIGERWRLSQQGRNLDTYLRLTLQLARDHPDVRLVVWPEAAMTFDVEAEPLYRASIGSLLNALDLELLAGGPRALPEADGRHANAAFVLSAAGEITGVYEKRALIPVAEFDPFEAISLQRRDFGATSRYVPGRVTPPLATRAGRAGVLICQEAMFGEGAVARVVEGATFLVNPANDSWVGDRRFALQQRDMAILRAVEQRRDLVRASTAGPSGVIDAWGRPLVFTEPLAEGTAAAPVVARRGRTLYARFGDAFGLVCLLAAGAACLRAWGRAPAGSPPVAD